MIPAPRRIALSLAVALPLLVLGSARVAQAVPESTLVVGNALAQHYGVPQGAVTGLLESGVSLDSVTQLLLVQESAGKSFDEVTRAYRAQGNDVRKTADQFGVAAEKYSARNVEAALERARADATEQASQEASEKAAEATGRAVDSLFGGRGGY